MGSCEFTVVEKRCVENTEKKYVRCRHFVLLDKIDFFYAAFEKSDAVH